VASIAPVLAGFRPLVHMSERGHMDGGDVLLVGKQFFVGQTARTDEQGSASLPPPLSRMAIR
jgi:dimethylargininase